MYLDGFAAALSRAWSSAQFDALTVVGLGLAGFVIAAALFGRR
jgi:hypothetical protein